MLSLKEINNIENEGFYKKAKFAFSKIKNIKELKIKKFLGIFSGIIFSFITLFWIFIFPYFNFNSDEALQFDNIIWGSFSIFLVSFFIGTIYLLIFLSLKERFFNQKIKFINLNTYFYFDNENFYDKKNINESYNLLQELDKKSKFLIKYNLDQSTSKLKHQLLKEYLYNNSYFVIKKSRDEFFNAIQELEEFYKVELLTLFSSIQKKALEKKTSKDLFKEIQKNEKIEQQIDVGQEIKEKSIRNI